MAIIEPGSSYGPVTVTIDPGDDGFMTGGCRGWNLVDEAGVDGAGSSGGSLDSGSLGSLDTDSLGS